MSNFQRIRPNTLGAQIHAVPDNEKATDRVSGKKLPWGYESTSTASVNLNDDGRRELPEKGPFGRSLGRRRGTSRSRSKTAEPAQMREEERVRIERERSEDKVFGTLGRRADRGREVLGDEQNLAQQQQPQQPQPQQPQQQVPANAVEDDAEATEVLLYGFGDDLQWAAIDFFERVSGGQILEDYDRVPPFQRGYQDVTRSFGRAAAQRSLGKAALRKKNRFAGGEHWIKVTFSSRGAAELAVARAPHVVKGYLVSAEPWQGRGPAVDKAVPATAQAGAMVTDENLPASFSTNTFDASPSGSQTLTSQTEHEEPPSQQQQQHQALPPWSQPASAVQPAAATGAQLAQSTQQVTNRTSGTGTVNRVQGARLITLLPAEQALMPKQPKQSWMTWIGASELIGTTVPRKEDGSFDYERASFYWRVFHWLDGVLGTDFCGLRGDE